MCVCVCDVRVCVCVCVCVSLRMAMRVEGCPYLWEVEGFSVPIPGDEGDNFYVVDSGEVEVSVILQHTKVT